MTVLLDKCLNSPTLMSWMNLGTRILTYLVIVPLALRFLPLEDFVAWQVFVSAIALVFAFDFGFSPTISRFIAYQATDDTDTNHYAIESILKTSFRIYCILGLCVLFVFAAGGYLFLSTVLGKTTNPPQAQTAWFVVSFFASLQMLSFYWTSYLTGTHKIPQVQLFQAVSTLLCSVLAIVSLFLHASLLVFTVLMHSAIAVNLLICIVYKSGNEKSQKTPIKNIANAPGTKPETTIHTIWASAWRSGLGHVFTLSFVHITNIVVAGKYPAEIAAGFLLASQVFRAVTLFANVPYYTRLPRMAALYSNGSEQKMLDTARDGMRKSYTVLALMLIAAMFLYEPIIATIKSDVTPVSLLFLYLMSLTVFFERFGAMHLHLLTTRNIIIWHKANGFTVLLAVILLVILLPTLSLLAIPAALLCANVFVYCLYTATQSYQCMTNQWTTFEIESGSIVCFVVLAAGGALFF